MTELLIDDWAPSEELDPSVLDDDPGPEERPLPDEPEGLTRSAPIGPRLRAVDGLTFVLTASDTVPAVWGVRDCVLHAEGEALMLVGPDGVGKTSLGQQLALARLGIHDELLGFPVAHRDDRRVLYIAADRPKQAARSIRRMITPLDHDVIRERLVVWKGPLEHDLGKEKTERCYLADFAESYQATDVIIDSLKDVAVDLVKDEVGSRVNVAIQETIARGIEVVVLHHQRKEQQGGRPPKSLADVYGSRWLTAGMGSVCLLWGNPGDLVVEFRHLKQPAEEVGPFKVLHDQTHGRSTVYESTDLEAVLANAQHGLVVAEAARLMFDTADPAPNEIEKARRRLEGLVKDEKARRGDDPDGLARYFTFESGRERRDP